MFQNNVKPETKANTTINDKIHYFANTIFSRNTNAKDVELILSNYSFICINKISELVANQKFYVAEYNKELDVFDSVEDSNNWLYQLYTNSNSTMGLSIKQLIQLICYWYYVEGNAYLWFRKSNIDGGVKAKYPQEIIILPSYEVTINGGTNRLIESYSLMLNNSYVTIPADEVCHIKSMSIPKTTDNQLYYYKGQSKFFNAISTVLSAYNELIKNSNEELHRQGNANIFLSNNEYGVSEQERQSWADAFTKRFGKEFAPIVFAGQIGTKVERLDTGNSILQQNTGAFAGGINTEFKRLITATYGMPLDFIDGTPAYTSNYKEMKATISEQTIEPLTNEIIDAINNFLKYYDNGAYSLQYTPFKYENLNDKVLIINTLFMMDAIEKNEARDVLGYETKEIFDTNNVVEPETETIEIEDEVKKKA